MFLLLIGAIATVSIPMAAGVFLTWLVPVIGQPRADLPVWSIFHFLWILPLMYIIGTLLEHVGKRLMPSNKLVRELVENCILVIILAATYRVFFSSVLGCLIAAVISMLMYVLSKPFIEWIERSAKEERA